MAERVQMSRQRAWRAHHPEAIIVDRTSKWETPSSSPRAHSPSLVDIIRDGEFIERVRKSEARAALVRHFRAHVENELALLDIDELKGRDLACWCPLDGLPCHADVLLELANGAQA